MTTNLVKGYWLPVKDGDPRAAALFKRHYTARQGVNYCRYGFSGKGESSILLTLDCKALFCWRLVKGEGVNCSVFHNESDVLSSDLIKEADELAWSRWQEERHYTYVDPKAVNGDGKCFKAAGWIKLKEHTKTHHLIILEILKS